MKLNKYEEINARRHEWFDEFADKYMFFAFTEEAYEEGRRKLGLKEDEDALYRTVAGGFVLKDRCKEMHEGFKKFDDEIKAEIAADETGDGFIYEMFLTELSNHEYAYSMDAYATLEVLGLTFEQVEADERLKHGFKKAERRILGWEEDDAV